MPVRDQILIKSFVLSGNLVVETGVAFVVGGG